MRSPVADLLGDLVASLGGIGVRWYLFGAQAAILHGAARLTADVDVTAELGSREPGELLDALRLGGFALRVADVDGFVARTRVLPLVHGSTGLPVDVVIAGRGPEEGFLRRAVVKEVEGLRIPVASAEDLVAMKILAGRPKDLDDARAVLAAQAGDLNLRRIRQTLRDLERALDRSDLLPALEAAAPARRRTRRGPVRSARRTRRRG